MPINQFSLQALAEKVLGPSAAGDGRAAEKIWRFAGGLDAPGAKSAAAGDLLRGLPSRHQSQVCIFKQ